VVLPPVIDHLVRGKAQFLGELVAAHLARPLCSRPEPDCSIPHASKHLHIAGPKLVETRKRNLTVIGRDQSPPHVETGRGRV